MKDEIDKLFYKLPKDQIENVFNQKECDIYPYFLGFTNIYENLSLIIPKHFTVIDLGCAYNPQCFYFLEHKKYVAIDISNCEKFKSDNCIIMHKTIEDFIKEDLSKYDLDETFAICSYVPQWGGDNRELVRKSFKNVFVYYPHGGFDHKLHLKNE